MAIPPSFDNSASFLRTPTGHTYSHFLLPVCTFPEARMGATLECKRKERNGFYREWVLHGTLTRWTNQFINHSTLHCRHLQRETKTFLRSRRRMRLQFLIPLRCCKQLHCWVSGAEGREGLHPELSASSLSCLLLCFPLLTDVLQFPCTLEYQVACQV